MALTTLSCDTIGDLDNGTARVAIDGALAEVIKDTNERGDDGKARKVTVTFTFKQLEKSANVTIDVEASVKVPSYKANPTVVQVRFQPTGGKNKPVAVFQEHTSENPEQTTID